MTHLERDDFFAQLSVAVRGPGFETRTYYLVLESCWRRMTAACLAVLAMGPRMQNLRQALRKIGRAENFREQQNGSPGIFMLRDG
jgi:hypothetical protein